MSWVNSVHRQFLPHGPSVLPFVGLHLSLCSLFIPPHVRPEGPGSARHEGNEGGNDRGNRVTGARDRRLGEAKDGETDVRKERGNHLTSLAPVPVTHILTLSGRSLQSQPFHRESFYVTGTRVPFSSCRVSPPSLRSLGSSLHSVPEPVGCRERSGKGRAEGQGETRQKEPETIRKTIRKT